MGCAYAPMLVNSRAVIKASVDLVFMCSSRWSVRFERVWLMCAAWVSLTVFRVFTFLYTVHDHCIDFLGDTVSLDCGVKRIHARL